VRKLVMLWTTFLLDPCLQMQVAVIARFSGIEAKDRAYTWR